MSVATETTEELVARVEALIDGLADEIVIPYAFDVAKIGHCPECGAEVRMFSGGQWWIDARNPPSFGAGWWCPPCLQAKTKAAANG